MKSFLTLLMITATHTLFAQKVIINGAEGNRLLKWSDFTGKVDKSSSFYAYTRWKSNIRFTSTQPKGDSLMVKGIEVTIQLDPENSWVKKDNSSDYLLQHEQGHLNIGLLYMKELLQKMPVTTFSKAHYQQEIQAILNNVSKKYKDMSLLYDNETDHSKNKDEQAKWNTFFESELAQ